MLLNHKIYGAGEKNLLILHGLFGMLDNWHNIATKAAGQGHRVILADLRNHGQSPHSMEMNYEVMADDIHELLDHLQIRKADIVGHSMGGKVAMQFALKYPERVNKLIVVDIAPKRYGRGHDNILEAFYSLDLSGIEKRSEAEAQMAERIEDPGLRLFLLKNLARNEAGAFEWKMNLDVLSDSYDNIRKAIESDSSFDGEVLFLAGEKSDYIRPDDEQQIMKLFPNAEFKKIEGAGHWVHADKPAEFLDSMLAFLERD